MKTVAATLGFLMSFVFLGLYALGIIDYLRIPDPSRLAILLPGKSLFFMLLIAVYTPATIAFATFMFPDLTVDDEGLVVEFAWKPIRVLWSELARITPARFLGIGMLRPAILVVARSKLTLFPRIYGLAYGFTGSSCFLVSSFISDYHRLVDDIPRHIKQNHRAHH